MCVAGSKDAVKLQSENYMPVCSDVINQSEYGACIVCLHFGWVYFVNCSIKI